MTVVIGTVATQFHFLEYLLQIFGVICDHCTVALGKAVASGVNTRLCTFSCKYFHEF
jgi:hypothetical protein